MSTPISDLRRGLLAAVAVLLLSGCDPGSFSGSVPTRTTVNVAGRPVTVAAPPGFCVDRRSTSQSASGAFVLLSDCQLLGGPRDAGRPPVGAALTASVATAGLAPGGDATRSLGELETFARTPQGRAALGRSGRGGDVSVLATQTQGDVLYMLIEDRGPQPIAGIGSRFWRAFLEVNDRTTALSMLAFDDSGIDAQDELNTLAAFAGAIRRAN